MNSFFAGSGIALIVLTLLLGWWLGLGCVSAGVIIGTVFLLAGLLAPEEKEYQISSMAVCGGCGKLKNRRDVKVCDVHGRKLFLCEKCVNQVTGKTPETENDALKVLKLRYAKGEITKEQYEQMKKDIEGL